ncbi:hypothetical protein RQP46_002834 [Phenoliferia psychrophenolica]
MLHLLPLGLLHLLAVSAAPLLKRDGLLQCLDQANLSPVSSSSSSYQSDVASYNQRLQPQPAAIVYPTSGSASDVSAAVLCASAAGVHVSARGGGHSYASYGLGGTDGALVIDMSGFKDISVGEDGVASVGGGQRLGDVALKLNDQGRGLPHGTCPFVGVGGHAGFGGFGLAGRRNGLLVDTISALDGVLANGTVFTNLTASDDADLFWALRGAAQSFGIITTFHFDTFAAPQVAVNFAYSWYGVSADTAASLFSSWQGWVAESAPADLGVSFTIGAGISCEISGVYYGSSDAFHDVFDSFIDSTPTGYSQSVKELSWIDSLAALAGSQKLNTTGVSDSRDDFSAKSLMTPEATLISDEALGAFFGYLSSSNTTTNWFVEVNLYGGNNSQINALTLDDNSFGHRNSLLTFQMYASSPSYGPPYPNEGFNFLEGMYNAIVDPMAEAWGSTVGAYINYVDPTLSANATKALYWGSQYDRLSTLKAKYDPAAIFSNPQSIIPASSA